MTTPLYSNQGRIFIRLPGGQYTYYSNAKMTGPAKSFGESAPVYGQDQDRAGRFKIIDRIPNTEENFWTTTMTGHVDRDNDSELALAAEQRCSIDIQVHYGVCNDPTDFTDFESAIIFENCRISNYQMTDLVALEPKDTQVVQETCNVSATTRTRLLNRKVSATGFPNTFAGVVTSITHCFPACATNCDPHGCGRIYALVAQNGVTDITLAVTWSDDNGLTWGSVQLSPTHTETVANVGYRSLQIQCTKDYVVIFNYEPVGGTGGTHYAVLAIPHTDFVVNFYADTTVAPLVVEPSTAQQIYTSFAVGGAVYYAGFTGGIDKLSNQLVATNLYTFGGSYDTTASDGLDENSMIFFYTDDSGHPWSLTKINGGPFVATSLSLIPEIDAKYGTGADFIVYSTAMISEDEWLIGIDTGEVLKTEDGGANWTIVYSGAAPVVSIQMATPSIGYMITSFSAGVYRTVDGGDTWGLITENASWRPSDIKNLACLCTCVDPNTYFVGGGLGINADLTTEYKAQGNTSSTTAILGYGAQ